MVKYSHIKMGNDLNFSYNIYHKRKNVVLWVIGSSNGFIAIQYTFL